MRHEKKLPGQRGAVAIEFAILLPFILMPLLAGTIDFGFLFHTKHIITGAAREGTMLAARDGTATQADVTGVVRQYIADNTTASILDASNAVVTLTRDDANAVVEVDVAYTITSYPLIQWQDILSGLSQVRARAFARPR